jgi:hypothetical protein
MTPQEQYHELSFYTLAHVDKDFIHQHIIDAYAAQTATEKTKPITIFFSVAGLYLFVEKNYTGRQVQKAHQLMAGKTKHFTNIILPENRGNITVTNVLNASPGLQRDEMIRKWCVSAWNAFSNQHDEIISLTEQLINNEK